MTDILAQLRASQETADELGFNEEMTRRYQIKQDVPKALRALGFVAYVTDASHPDDPAGEPLSVSWHQSLADAQRIAKAMEYAYPSPLSH